MNGLVLLALAAAGCGAGEAPTAGPRPAESVGRSDTPRLPPAPTSVPAPVERLRILEMRANDEFGFAREGGLLALSLLQGAEIELVRPLVVLTVRGETLATGALVQSGEAFKLVFEDESADWLAGDLAAESAGQRTLSTRWATFTLVPLVQADPREKLCAGEEPGPPGPIRTLVRRVACEPHETELAPSGGAVSITPYSEGRLP